MFNVEIWAYLASMERRLALHEFERRAKAGTLEVDQSLLPAWLRKRFGRWLGYLRSRGAATMPEAASRNPCGRRSIWIGRRCSACGGPLVKRRHYPHSTRGNRCKDRRRAMAGRR